MICGAEIWKDIEIFAISKVVFLSIFLELPNGIPKLDTYRHVFAAIDSEQFEKCFIEWVNSLEEISKGNTITIDSMGFQTKIVEKIIAEKENYIIAVKENQKTLYQEIEDEFRSQKIYKGQVPKN